MGDFREQPRVPAGSERGGEWVGDKTSRAKLTHKPSTREKRNLASQSEHHIAIILGGLRTDNNKPMDTIVTFKGKLFGIEVKTLMDNANDKITMHGESLARKVQWAHRNHASLHTVVVDMRGAEPRVFYRHGVGSFRLHTLTPVNTPAHLRELVGLL